jgi:hypothetical protein
VFDWTLAWHRSPENLNAFCKSSCKNFDSELSGEIILNQMEFNHEILSGIPNETARKLARKINAESFERRILTSDTRGPKSTPKLKRCFVRTTR